MSAIATRGNAIKTNCTPAAADCSFGLHLVDENDTLAAQAIRVVPVGLDPKMATKCEGALDQAYNVYAYTPLGTAKALPATGEWTAEDHFTLIEALLPLARATAGATKPKTVTTVAFMDWAAMKNQRLAITVLQLQF